MSVYTPKAVAHPTFTFPDNGGTENAALFVGLPQLADEIAFVAAGGYMVPQNWEPGGATTHNLKRLAFCERDVRWFGVSNVGLDSLESSVSFGRSWTDLAGSLGASNTLLDVAVASVGTALDGVVVVMTSSSRDVYRGTRSAFATVAFALVTNALTAIPTGGAIDFEPTSGIFVACYRVGATGHFIDVSSDGTTWLNRTLPGAWSAYAGANSPEVACNEAGKSVAIFADDGVPGGAIQVVRSSGGVTWAGSTVTPAALTGTDLAAPVLTRPVYDAASGKWYFIVGTTSGSGTASEVWSSGDDGATWSFVASLAVIVQGLAVVGGLAAVTTKGRIIVSTDSGATWRYAAAIDGTASAFYMRGAGGGLLAVNSTDSTSVLSPRSGQAIGQLI